MLLKNYKEMKMKKLCSFKRIKDKVVYKYNQYNVSTGELAGEIKKTMSSEWILSKLKENEKNKAILLDEENDLTEALKDCRQQENIINPD